MTSWAARHAKPSPRKKKAFKLMVGISLVFWIPIFGFSLYKSMLEPLFVLANKQVTLGVQIPDQSAWGQGRYARQKYLYASHGQLYVYPGSRLKWSQSPNSHLQVWHSEVFPGLAFIPEIYFHERFLLFAATYGLVFLFLLYVRFLRRETLKNYFERRIREEVG